MHAPTPVEATALRGARVLIVGMGGLGNPAANLLAAAGVGYLGLVDYDRVELSNLPRQILFDEVDLGEPKAAAAGRLKAAHPALQLAAHEFRLDASNGLRLMASYDFIIDATDSIESKFLMHDIALTARRPLCHAGVSGTRALLMTVLPGTSACLRCLFPEPPGPDEAPTCNEAGVLGPLVGLFGSLQATEAIKYFTDGEPNWLNRVLSYDTDRWRVAEIGRDPGCRTCGALP